MKFRYTVPVTLLAEQTVEVEVEATNEREAKRLAEEAAEPDDFDWLTTRVDAAKPACLGPVEPPPPPVHPGQKTIEG